MTENERETVRQILGAAGVGILLAGAALAPNILIALAPLMGRKAKLDEHAAHQALRYARKKKWVEIRETQHGVEVRLTEKRGEPLESN